MIDYDYTSGRLTLAGTVMNGPAWHCPDLAELTTGAAVRGTDVLVPGRPGVIPYRRRPTVTKVSLRMAIAGDVAQDGTSYGIVDPDDWSGLYRNVAALRALVIDPVAGDPGTIAAVLELPPVKPDHTGPQISGQVHVEGFTPGKRLGGIMVGVLTISIPAGALA